ncbi:hypothetical protein A8C28_22510 [Klebsiella pneumoniae]|uniref:hypothetical protein n=1 Tax=Klebsiella pneumoniae TaxID=573 RepID=UPI00073C41DD|nr:hypothetical protein [Klebsiella pneumoniae]EIW9108717.1 hypothetical protein [Klebsiella pneumoniae]KSX31754.1 hypothetical protein APT85_23185 [Klebsiella pneumoniae]CAA1274403.1 Uncharacterised protein [Klebsiella pneumoniae]SWB99050.1 Uncharacterised protein [Klebsiella pneumoniae]SWG43194.1 Uncharacterised protein [Klebsiella pneumoniae]
MKYKINIRWEETNIHFTRHETINYKNRTFFFKLENNMIYRKKGNFPVIENEPDNTLFIVSKIDNNNYILESTGIHKDEYFDIEQKVLDKFNSMAFKAGMTKTELRFLTSCPSCFMYKYNIDDKVDLVFISIPLIDDLYDLSINAPIPLINITKMET